MHKHENGSFMKVKLFTHLKYRTVIKINGAWTTFKCTKSYSIAHAEIFDMAICTQSVLLICTCYRAPENSFKMIFHNFIEKNELKKRCLLTDSAFHTSSYKSWSRTGKVAKFFQNPYSCKSPLNPVSIHKIANSHKSTQTFSQDSVST